MTMVRSVLLPFSLAGTLVLLVSAQEPDSRPQAQILWPDADTYLSGPVTLAASIEPPSAAANVIFSVDGRPVCTIERPPFECAWDAGSNVASHQVRLVIALAGGGRIVRTVRTKGLQFAEKVDVDAVQVTVTVTDEAGQFVPDLPRSAFRVFEDGSRQAISYFTSRDVPLELVVAIDISGSMAPAMLKLKSAVRGLLAAVPEKNQVTLLGFNDSIFALARKATDPAERVRAVDRLAPWGATALYDAILRGGAMIGRQVGRKAVVAFTDGEDQGSHVAIQDVERWLESSDVTIYMIGQGRGVTQDYLKKIMERLTTKTGGRAFFTDSIDELQNTFKELLDELSNQYLVGYQPSNTKRDSKWREIRVEVDGYPNVRARQGYRAVPLK